MKKIYVSQANLKALVDSDYAKPFNPFVHYFTSLEAWDGKTDHIGQLTKTVKAEDQAFLKTVSAAGWWEWWHAPSMTKCKTTS
ncbi:hypothetical protein SFC43_00150 [Bacteroides sp. CR5/BHMF/2]|nr:hypothetical protein [Bacteroides sp. CR5/BHMF/2]